MPSIRLRASAYSSLRDVPPNEPEPPVPSLANLFQQVQVPNPNPIANADVSTSTEPLSPRAQRSLPAMRNPDLSSLEPPPPLPFGRPRSGTTTSRIHTFIHNSAARRYPRVTPSNNDSRSSIVPITSPVSIHIEEGDTSNDRRSVSSVSSPKDPANSLSAVPGSYDNDLHHDDIVEHLDVIDPQIATASNLTNAANSIIFPPLSFYSRKPILVLPTTLTGVAQLDLERQSSHLDDSLDVHVDDVLRRPSKIKRTLRGIWSYLKTPMGIITGIYGFLVAFWGAAIVIFVAKIINLHNPNRQGFWVEISSQIENGLFTITGVGLIPFRVVDTYRIYWIWYYKRKTQILRAKAGLPPLIDPEDLPDEKYDPNYVHVLTEKEEQFLHRQQCKFQHSQTWYRPHGTETHRAFPINMALLICLFVDGNSIFQVGLCGTMWGLNRFQRPAWSTALLISFSFLCGIIAAVLIWRGSQNTKRVAEVVERLRAVLAADRLERKTNGEDGPLLQTDQNERATEKENDTQVDGRLAVPASGSKQIL